MKKQPEITDATKQRILDSFWELFQNTPIEKITAANIAAGANIHRSSYYRYFTDIYQVLDAFQSQLLKDLKRETEQIQNAVSITLPDYTEQTAVVLVKYADKLYRMLNYKETDFRQHFTDSVRPNIEKCLHITASTPDSEYITTFLISCMLTNFNFWYEHQEQYSLQHINAMGQKLLLDGISTYL